MRFLCNNKNIYFESYIQLFCDSLANLLKTNLKDHAKSCILVFPRGNGWCFSSRRWGKVGAKYLATHLVQWRNYFGTHKFMF